jgi:hypothetical protein
MVEKEDVAMADEMYDREDGGFLYGKIPRERVVVQHRNQGV